MRISNQPIFISKNNQVGGNKICYPCYSRGLEKDTFTPTLSFTALKKSAFNGIDFAVVEKFKAPIEKFNSTDDFNTWADNEFYKICCKKYGGRQYETVIKRESMICLWEENLSFCKCYTPAEKLLIMDSMTKDLKPNDDNICPIFNKKVLDDTLDEVKNSLSKDRKYQFDFGKIYKSNLRKMYIENSSFKADESKWIIIPSQINDPDNFESNIEKLQTLSSHEWCTKQGGARVYLSDGDMHIYMEQGKPKLAIRFNEDVVKEVNSELNDYIIPKEYIGILDNYMKENDFLTTERVDETMQKSKDLAGIGQTDSLTKEPATDTNKNSNKTNLFSFFTKLFN